MYSTGIRRAELLGLKLKDVDSSRMVINIRQGKGKKDRQVVLHPELLKLLRGYYKHYRPRCYLFEGYGPEGRYSATSLMKIVKRYGKESRDKQEYICSHFAALLCNTHVGERCKLESYPTIYGAYIT